MEMFLLTFISASDFGVDIGGDSFNVNVYQGNLTNLSQMQDTNIPSPSNNEVLSWSTATGKWIAQAVSAISDTFIANYSTFLTHATETYVNEQNTSQTNYIGDVNTSVTNTFGSYRTLSNLSFLGGNVGIGTTSPNGLLNVNGTGILFNVTNTTGGDVMVVDGTSGDVIFDI